MALVTPQEDPSEKAHDHEKFIIRMTLPPMHPDAKRTAKPPLTPVTFFMGRRGTGFAWTDSIKYAKYFRDIDSVIAMAHTIEDHANSLFASGVIGRLWGEDMNTLEVLSIKDGNLRLVPYASKIKNIDFDDSTDQAAR